LQRERRRGKYQQRRRAAGRRHASDTRGLDAAVGPDAVDDRQFRTDFILRNVEDAALLVEGAGRNFSRMGVDGDRGQALDGGDIAQMLAEVDLVDRQVVLERQQHRRNDAVGDVIYVPGHGFLRPIRHSGTARSAGPGI
jgi:hypothetical protein